MSFGSELKNTVFALIVLPLLVMIALPAGCGTAQDPDDAGSIVLSSNKPGVRLDPHCPSSNKWNRRSAFLKESFTHQLHITRHGVNVALGLDSLTLNDDEDMIQEMRLVSTLHRNSGSDLQQTTTRRSLEMASINGAKALGIDNKVGTLAPGKKADLVLLDLDSLDGNFADLPTDSADFLLHRAKAGEVGTIIINGEIVMHEGKHAHLDKENMQLEIRNLLARQTGSSETHLNAMIAELKPYAGKLIGGQ